MKTYLFYGAILTFLLWSKKRDPVASVDFETPTVVGSGSENFGGTDYATTDDVL